MKTPCSENIIVYEINKPKKYLKHLKLFLKFQGRLPTLNATFSVETLLRQRILNLHTHYPTTNEIASS